STSMFTETERSRLGASLGQQSTEKARGLLNSHNFLEPFLNMVRESGFRGLLMEDLMAGSTSPGNLS
ncbi:hypothetical protein KI387_040287, partial [Taxus chinensis]